MYYNLNVSSRTKLGTKAFKYAAPSDWTFLQMNLRLDQLVPFRYFKTLFVWFGEILFCVVFHCVLFVICICKLGPPILARTLLQKRFESQ